MDVLDQTGAQERRETQVCPEWDVPERRETLEELDSQETPAEEATEETPARTVCPVPPEHPEKRETTALLETQDVTEQTECPDLKETLQPL